MTDLNTLLKELKNLHHDTLDWKTDHISIQVCNSQIDDSPYNINFAGTLGHDVKVTKFIKPEEVYWLARRFDQNVAEYRKEVIAPVFVKACRLAGFKIVMKEDRELGGPISCIVFSCDRFRYYRKSHNKSADTRTRTARPIKGTHQLCNFGFRVYWNGDQKRWFLPKKQLGSCHHAGHIKRSPDQITLSTTSIGRDAIEIAKNSLSLNVNPNTTAALIYKETGVDLQYHQLYHLKQDEIRNAFYINIANIGCTNTIQNPTYRPSSADKLLAELEADPKTSFVVIFADYDTEELKIRQRRKVDGFVSTTVPEGLADDTDSAVELSERIRNALSITGSGQILLAIAWTNDEARRKFEMFPEFTAGDITFGTNSEKRPEALHCGKDSNNNSFVHTWAFLPSQVRWVLNWLYLCAIPTLHSSDTLFLVHVHCTDEDPRAYEAFDLAVEEEISPQAAGRLCAFHKINRNLTQHASFKAHIAEVENSGVTNHIEFQFIIQWLWTFIYVYETWDEVVYSMNRLKFYLEEDECLHRGQLGQLLREKLVHYINNQFWPLRARLFRYNFVTTPGGDNATSNICEAENRSAKVSQTGCKPKDNLHDSYEAQMGLDGQRARKKDRSNAHKKYTSVADANQRTSDCSWNE